MAPKWSTLAAINENEEPHEDNANAAGVKDDQDDVDMQQMGGGDIGDAAPSVASGTTITIMSGSHKGTVMKAANLILESSTSSSFSPHHASHHFDSLKVSSDHSACPSASQSAIPSLRRMKERCFQNTG